MGVVCATRLLLGEAEGFGFAGKAGNVAFGVGLREIALPLVFHGNPLDLHFSVLVFRSGYVAEEVFVVAIGIIASVAVSAAFLPLETRPQLDFGVEDLVLNLMHGTQIVGVRCHELRRNVFLQLHDVCESC